MTGPAVGRGSTAPSGFIRTVLGDRDHDRLGPGVVYGHEHLVIDSPLVADRFPHIHLHDVEAAVREVAACGAAGAVLMLDAMPAAAGRDAVRLAEISRRTGVDIVTTTGLHHDRYYGPRHWTNQVGVDALVELFVADLTIGVDRYDYTGPVVDRTPYRAGVVKAATSGAVPDRRDRRLLDVAARVSCRTGAPVLTHCEGGHGGMAQVELLTRLGVPAGAIILSHVDKSDDLGYLKELGASGAVLELDQALRQHSRGLESITVRAILTLLDAGHGDHVIVGTDGARRDLWAVHGGRPGLAWLAAELPAVLTAAGVGARDLQAVLHDNAARALAWRNPDDRRA